MLVLNTLQQNKEEIIRKLKVKHFDARPLIDQILELDTQRKNTQKILDDSLSEANNIAKQIGSFIKNNEHGKAEELKSRTAQLKEIARDLAEKMKELEKMTSDLLVLIPNTPHDSVPEGKDETDNIVVRSGGKEPVHYDSMLPHWDIAAKSGIIDFETGNKITGAGFPLYKGKGAKLQRALINFFLDEATKFGYTEMEPPIMVNEATAYGTGQLPDKDSQMYFVGLDGFYLVPTAEVPLTNVYRDVILEHTEFPVRMTAYTPCFRREAGSYGKNVRGLNRLHQFDKVEIVNIAHPEHSYEILDEMVNYVESLVKKLGLTYRIVKLCGKDMSFTSSLTYDFEVWSAAQQRWLEVSSVSNFESFQAVRMKLRFRDENKKVQFAHTLNGSALALPRIVAAILENNQQNNQVNIPEVLLPYTGFDKIEF